MSKKQIGLKHRQEWMRQDSGIYKCANCDFIGLVLDPEENNGFDVRISRRKNEDRVLIRNLRCRDCVKKATKGYKHKKTSIIIKATICEVCGVLNNSKRTECHICGTEIKTN